MEENKRRWSKWFVTNDGRCHNYTIIRRPITRLLVALISYHPGPGANAEKIVTDILILTWTSLIHDNGFDLFNNICFSGRCGYQWFSDAHVSFWCQGQPLLDNKFGIKLSGNNISCWIKLELLPPPPPIMLKQLTDILDQVYNLHVAAYPK